MIMRALDWLCKQLFLPFDDEIEPLR
jgi:hypothetical protein